MAKYSITVKLGDYLLEVNTSDRDFVDEQLGLWIVQSAEFAKKIKVKKSKKLVEEQIRKESEITKQKVDEQIASVVGTHVHNQSDVKKDESVKISDSVASNLDVFYTPTQAKTISDISKESTGGVFDSILENKIKHPQTELTFKSSPTIKKDNAFINFITSKNIEKKTDYLLMAAYYMSQYEQIPRFTLKQINAKLMQNIAVIIDHSVLQDAINNDYIECLPDLTGVVGSSEYRLTAYGEKVLLDSLS